jgi:hypothetical protein
LRSFNKKAGMALLFSVALKCGFFNQGVMGVYKKQVRYSKMQPNENRQQQMPRFNRVEKLKY